MSTKTQLEDIKGMKRIKQSLTKRMNDDIKRYDLKIRDVKDLYSPYDFNRTVLNQDLIKDLISESRIFQQREFIIHHIEDINEADIANFIECRDAYYLDKAQQELAKKRINFYKILVCFLSGVLLLLLGVVFKNESIFSEIILIAGWFFIWEGVDNAFLKTREYNLELMRLLILKETNFKFEKIS